MSADSKLIFLKALVLSENDSFLVFHVLLISRQCDPTIIQFTKPFFTSVGSFEISGSTPRISVTVQTTCDQAGRRKRLEHETMEPAVLKIFHPLGEENRLTSIHSKQLHHNTFTQQDKKTRPHFNRSVYEYVRL